MKSAKLIIDKNQVVRMFLRNAEIYFRFVGFFLHRFIIAELLLLATGKLQRKKHVFSSRYNSWFCFDE